MSSVMLRADNISKSYKSGVKEVRAVDSVSLEIKKGESLCIIGPSGAGKSTLLQLLGGLDFPTSGNITLDDIDIYKLSDKGRAKIRNKRIGFVFQFYHLLPEFSAIENVMLPAMISGMDRVEKAREILRSVGLGERIAHKPGELSGGESQRVAIARAIINEPEILLCDEPTGNLDSKTSEGIYELLFELRASRKMTLVIVTHDERIASKMDRAIRIVDGRIASQPGKWYNTAIWPKRIGIK